MNIERIKNSMLKTAAAHVSISYPWVIHSDGRVEGYGQAPTITTTGMPDISNGFGGNTQDSGKYDYEGNYQLQRAAEAADRARQLELYGPADNMSKYNEIYNSAVPMEKARQINQINEMSLQNPVAAAYNKQQSSSMLSPRQRAYNNGARVLNTLGSMMDRGLNRIGEMYDANLTRAKEAQGLTPAQIHGPSAAEYQKGHEIYGPNDTTGFMTPVRNSPLWEKTPQDYARDAEMAKRNKKWDAQSKKRRAIWDAQSRARQFKRNQERFGSYLDDARNAWSPEERDRALMKARLLPPRDASDEFTQHVWFPGEI